MIVRTTSHAALFAIGLLLWFPTGGATVELDPRLEAAVALYREDGAAMALPVFEQLARQFDDSGRPIDRAAALHYSGECYWRLGDFPRAREYLNRALALERRTGNRAGKGKTLNVLGLLDWDEGNYDEAIDRFTRARAVARALGDRRLEGASLNNLSLVYDELGDYDVSLRQYEQVLELYRSVDFPRGVGDTLGNIGGLHLLLGQFQEALGFYMQALAISERLASKTSLSQDHGNIALCLLGMGEIATAMEHFDRAIVFANESGMRQDEAYWMRQKGNGLIRQGQYDRGLASHRAALAVYETLGAKVELAEALHDYGTLLLRLGDPESAEQSFQRALLLADEAGQSRGMTLNRIALGDLELRRGNFAGAVRLYQQALEHSTATGELRLQARARLSLARAYREQQQLLPAGVEAERALAIASEMAARPLQAEALLARAETRRRLGRPREALEDFAAAESALGEMRDPDLLWRIQFGRARAQQSIGDLQAAISSLLAAVGVIESVRDQLQEPRFRAGFVDDKYEVYVELVRLQLRLGLTADAFSTAERLRARSFAEQLGGRSLLPLAAADRQKELQIQERIRQLRQALTDEGEDGAPVHSERARNRFSAELLRAEQEYQSFLDDRVAGTSSPRPTPDAPEEAAGVQQFLRDDEALIEYVVAADQVVAFLATSDGITATTSAISAADLTARVALLRDLVQRPGDERWLQPAAGLADVLLRPLEDLPARRTIRRLYVVPHGVLNSMPFAVLPLEGSDDRRLLVDRYTVVYLPAAAALRRETPVSSQPTSLLAMAPARSRLRYAPEEVHSLDALFEPHARLVVGATATESLFKRLAGDFTVLHLATHGVFNKASPLLSGLELEADGQDDGLLQVHEVLGLRLQARLVTLSACETALGSGYFSDVPAGDEFVGMSRAFLAAGTGSVLAALWEVDDRASLLFMQRFYERFHESAPASDASTALAEAQRGFRDTHGLGHPYYWAPFITVGAVSNRHLTAELHTGWMQ